MKKPSLLVIFLTVFIDLVGFGIVLPLLPKYAEDFGARGFQIGLIISSYSLMQFFFAPRWGRLSDRIGRRPVILISTAGSAASYALFGVSGLYPGSTGLLMLLVSRVFAGICGANLSVASAYIADLTTHENRSKGMGLIGMAFGLGFILGPAIGSLSAARFGLSGPGWVAGLLCAANFILACFILRESRKPEAQPAVRRLGMEQWLHTLRQPKLRLLILLFFLATFCFASFESTLPLLLSNRFGLDWTKIGYIFAYCGLVAAFIQGGVIGKLVKRFGESHLIFGSLIVVAASLILIPFAPHFTALLIGLGVFSAGSGINRAPTMGMISIHSPPDEQGATLGVAQSAGTMARILGPVFATALYAFQAPLPYVIAGVIAFVAALLAWHFLCREKEQAEPADLPRAVEPRP